MYIFGAGKHEKAHLLDDARTFFFFFFFFAHTAAACGRIATRPPPAQSAPTESFDPARPVRERQVAAATSEKVIRVSLAALKHLTEGEVRETAVARRC